MASRSQVAAGGTTPSDRLPGPDLRPAPVALALGANQGSCARTLSRAVAALAGVLHELRVGDLYRSRPEGGRGGPDYWNTAITGTTTLPPEALLALGKALERAAGREPGPRGGPRPLDVDLLLWGGLRRDAPGLTLPHPRLRARPFVLAPLADVAPELPVPPDGTSVAELLARLGAAGLERVGWPEGAPGSGRP